MHFPAVHVFLDGPGLVRGRLVRGRLTMKPKVDRKFVLSI